MFFQNGVYSLFQATCANLCESMVCYGVVDKTANKTKLICWDCFLQIDGHFLENVGCFLWRSLKQRIIVFIGLEIICGVVISFDVLEVLPSISSPDIHDKLKTYEEIWVKLDFLPFSLIFHTHLELPAHSKQELDFLGRDMCLDAAWPSKAHCPQRWEVCQEDFQGFCLE